jgi:hypothetical protein
MGIEIDLGEFLGHIHVGFSFGVVRLSPGYDR